MRGRLGVAVLVALGAAGVTFAEGPRQWSAKLIGFNEVPAVSTVASGRFRATVGDDEGSVDWELSYEDLEGDTLSDKVRELIALMRRHSRLDELAVTVARLRPGSS